MEEIVIHSLKFYFLRELNSNVYRLFQARFNLFQMTKQQFQSIVTV